MILLRKIRKMDFGYNVVGKARYAFVHLLHVVLDTVFGRTTFDMMLCRCCVLADALYYWIALVLVSRCRRCFTRQFDYISL
jgi:hypothetical protein